MPQPRFGVRQLTLSVPAQKIARKRAGICHERKRAGTLAVKKGVTSFRDAYSYTFHVHVRGHLGGVHVFHKFALKLSCITLEKILLGINLYELDFLFR